jgi:hypothetical protein
LAGLYFAQKADAQVLLLIPLLSPTLGIMWVNHAIGIGNIGRFVQDKIMPRLSKTLRSDDLPDYEKLVRDHDKRKGAVFLRRYAPVLLIFALLPAGALVIALLVPGDKDWKFWALTVLGAILIIIFGGFVMSMLFGWAWKNHSHKQNVTPSSAS